MDSTMQVNLISTNNEIGELRRKSLLPELSKLGIEYKLYLGDIVSHVHKSLNLWNTVKNIIKDNKQLEYVIIMEDDCTFKNKPIKEELLKNIESVKKSNVKAIFTGCSKVTHSNKTITDSLISINAAHNSQLVIIFKDLYQTILNYPQGGNWDIVLSSMSQLKDTQIALTLPFLTGQLKTGISNLNPNIKEEIGERFEIEEQRLLKIFNK